MKSLIFSSSLQSNVIAYDLDDNWEIIPERLPKYMELSQEQPQNTVGVYAFIAEVDIIGMLSKTHELYSEHDHGYIVDFNIKKGYTLQKPDETPMTVEEYFSKHGEDAISLLVHNILGGMYDEESKNR